MRVWHVFIALALAVAIAPPAFAQDTTGAAIAETLFQEGRSLMGQKKYAEACARFAESERLDPNMSTLLNLGYCYELAGKTVAAWITFREAAAMARRENRPDRREVAEKRAAELAARMPKLTLTITEPAPNLVIEIDGTALTEGVASVAIPLDPGTHIIVVTADGKQRWETSVTMPESGSEELVIPALTDASVKPAPQSEDEPAPDTTWWTGQHIAGLTTMGLGVASLGVGIAVGALTLSKASDVDQECVGNTCSQKGIDLNDDAHGLATASTVLFVAAGVLGAVGVTIVLTGADEPVAASLTVSPDSLRLQLAF